MAVWYPEELDNSVMFRSNGSQSTLGTYPPFEFSHFSLGSAEPGSLISEILDIVEEDFDQLRYLSPPFFLARFRENDGISFASDLCGLSRCFS